MGPLVKSERYSTLFYSKKPLRDKIMFFVKKTINLMLLFLCMSIICVSLLAVLIVEELQYVHEPWRKENTVNYI